MSDIPEGDQRESLRDHPALIGWLEGAIDRFIELESRVVLPAVSSALYVCMCIEERAASLDEESSPERSPEDTLAVKRIAYRYAVESLALSYLKTFKRFDQLRRRSTQGHAHIRSVLSLCTGFDALVEIVALFLLSGERSAYLSIELNEEAVEFNRYVCGEIGPGGASLRFCADTIRGDSWLSQLTQDAHSSEVVGSADHFPSQVDLCISLYPPITSTAYSDLRRVEPGEWLAPTPDPSVILELLSVLERRLLDAPIGLIFFTESEARYLEVILEALGYTQEVTFISDPIDSRLFVSSLAPPATLATHNSAESELDSMSLTQRCSAYLHLGRSGVIMPDHYPR